MRQPKRPKVTKNCQTCGTEYQIKQSAAAKSKFCSRACQSKAKLRKTPLVCQRCGTQFEVPQCYADRYKFCSKKCRGDLQSRFWEKVRKTNTCWLWEGANPGGRGYGQIRIGESLVSTHRLSWEMHNGPIPDGQQVLHECDTPACVNPDHLFLGTNQENMEDRDEKERQARGTSHGMSKLTEESALDIFYASGTQEEIAARHRVSQNTVSLIKNRKTWKHVT